MRIIHTADWHIGARLENFDREYEHVAFFNFLSSYMREQKAQGRPIDALLISGDLYNSFIPPQEASKTLFSFLRELLTEFIDLNIYITSGNHDNGALLDNLGVLCMCDRMHILGSVPLKICEKQEAYQSSSVSKEVANTETEIDSKISSTELTPATRFCVDLDRMIKPLKNCTGEIAGFLAMVPFVREGAIVRGSLFDDDKMHSASECIAKLALDLAHRIDELKQEYKLPHAASLAMFHLALSGKVHDDEHTQNLIATGGLVGQGSEGIDYFDYSALGHIHLRYSTGSTNADGSHRLCYSGSPIPVTFNEATYNHGFNVLEIKKDGSIVKEVVKVPRSVQMIRIPPKVGNSAEELGCTPQEALDLVAKLPNDPLPLEQRPLVTIFLKGETFGDTGGRSRTDVTAEIRKVFPENCRLCSVRTVEAPRKNKEFAQTVVRDLQSVTPQDVFAMYICKKLNTEEVPSELLQLFTDVVKKVVQTTDTPEPLNVAEDK